MKKPQIAEHEAAQITSTILFVPANRLEALSLLQNKYKESKKSIIVDFLGSLINLLKAKETDYVTLQDLEAFTGHSYQKLLRSLRTLSNDKVFDTESAHKVLDVKMNQSVSFKYLSEEFQESFSKEAITAQSGGAIVSRINDELNRHEIDSSMTSRYRENAKNADHTYLSSITNSLRPLIAPGNSIQEMRMAKDGTSAVSIYGVFNDFDSQTLHHLYTLTIFYLESLPQHLKENFSEREHVPIYMIDLLKRFGFPTNSEPARIRISKSIIRIYATMFNLKNQQLNRIFNVEDSEILRLAQGAPSTAAIQLLTNIIMIGQNATLEPKSDELIKNINMDSSDEVKRIEDRLQSVWQDALPFSAVLIQWKDIVFAGQFSQKKLLLATSKESSQLPTLLWYIYTQVRYDRGKQVHYILTEENGTKSASLSLQSLVRLLWPFDEEEMYDRLCKDIVGEVIKVRRSLSSFVTSDESRSKRRRRVTLNLHGVIFDIDIPNFDSPRNAANRRSVVEITYEEEQVITSSGAQYNAKVARNAPTVPNPIYGQIGSASSLTNRRRVLPPASLAVKDMLKNYTLGIYTISFELSGQEYLVHRYMTNQEFTDTLHLVSTLTRTNAADVEMFMRNQFDKLEELEGIDLNLLNRFCEITSKSKVQIIRTLIRRSISKHKLVDASDYEIDEYFRSEL